MATSFAYPWNAPRSAIASPYLTHAQQQGRDRFVAALQQARMALSLQPDCVRFDVWRTLDALEQQRGSPRANAFLIRFCSRMLPRLRLVSERYASPGLQDSVSRAVFDGHFDTRLLQYLASRLVELVARYNRLPDMSRADIDLLAADIASFIRGELANMNDAGMGEYQTLYAWYQRAGIITRQFNVAPPHWERMSKTFFNKDDAAAAVIRMFSEAWWRGRLRRTAAAWREVIKPGPAPFDHERLSRPRIR